MGPEVDRVFRGSEGDQVYRVVDVRYEFRSKLLYDLSVDSVTPFEIEVCYGFSIPKDFSQALAAELQFQTYHVAGSSCLLQEFVIHQNVKL